MSNDINILVFGSSGSGKTSMINQLTGEIQPVGDGIMGITFKSSPFDPLNKDDKEYIFWDTTGLNESLKGTISHKESIKSLVNLIKNSKDGYNLLIHVIRILPRTTDTWEQNHKLFVEIVAQNKIPTVIVFTGCEDNDPMHEWYTKNELHLNNLNLKSEKIICTCFHQKKISGGRSSLSEIYELLRHESGDNVWESINNYASEESISLFEDDDQFMVVIKKSINFFYGIFFNDSNYWRINSSIQDLLKKLGFTNEESKVFAETGKFTMKD